MRTVCACVVAALVAAGEAAADERAADPGRPVTVSLKDGGRLVGEVVAEDEDSITVRIAGGLEVRLVRDAIERVEGGRRTEGVPSPAPGDPNDSRLMFAPSGRPLGKGNGYVSNHYVLFPGFAYGLTRNVSFGAGVSTIPGLGLDEQVYYGNLQAAFKVSEKASFALGGLYLGAPAWDDDLGSAAVAYGLTTIGRADLSLTLGFAVASVRDQEPIFDRRGYYVGDTTFWRHEPIAMVGGSARVARKLFLVSENWLFLDKPMSEQAFGLALRFFSGRISVDAGFVFVPEILDEGLPIPWLSFSYHFGPSRSKAAASKPGGFEVTRRSAR